MNSQDPNDTIVKYFLMFMKEEGIFNLLYKMKEKYQPTIKRLKKRITSPSKVNDLWLDISPYIFSGEDNQIKRLQLSQLWRLYLYSKIDSIPFNDDDEKKKMEYRLRHALEANGCRGSERVGELYKQYFGKELGNY